MAISLSGATLAALVAVLFVAGATNGLAGFGFALVGTMSLATAVAPSTAVVFMILPLVAVNLSLVADLTTSELRTCGRRFGVLVGAALVGTVVGMFVLESIPTAPLRVGLGLLTLGFVATTQRVVAIPDLPAAIGDRTESTVGMLGVGAVGGVLFGATNVGVQLIAYLKRFDLSHGVFVGVAAMLFLGINGARVVIAGFLGLYPDLTVVVASLGACIPAVLGVIAGKRLRAVISQRARRVAVLALLTGIGVRLFGGGLGLF
ncbi:sulfite exporter TauE/SafE family protein [Halolamina sp.]|jgi:hypothetical protein|uniref:sulfite exporter TauE/SafE family protein n=1 Tax=Halolamina sp. TaxID=1940283 RepID=UPI000223B96C|nr:protein of unknown function DUF81 [halophilic archaeon DL31]